jgi:signal transduction histidine kinase
MDAPGGIDSIDLAERRPDLTAELSETNVSLLIAAAPVISFFFLIWAGFDRLIAPQIWLDLLVVRALVVVVNTIVVIWASKSRHPARGEVGFWLWLLVWSLGISAMLPFVGDGFEAYVVGLSIALVGAGILPYWGPVWSVSIVLVCAGAASFGVLFASPSTGELLTFVFVILTTSTVSIVGSVFRIHLKRREFEARSESERLRRAELERSNELSNALDRLSEVDRLKNEFFANISHELRTPLTLILSPVDELLANMRPGAERDALKVVRRNATRLLRMIDDLLDLARLEAGGLRLRVSQVDVAKLAEQVAGNARPTATSKGIEMAFSTEGEPSDVFGDPHRIEIILTNLVGNAIKFTPSGGRIQVSVFHNAAGAAVEVTDTGPGISREEQQRVFDRFHQTETSERRSQGGVGIGLALAHELAQLHGGSLTLQSTLGQGSTFTLFLQSGKDHFHTEVTERRQLQTELHPGRRVDDRPTQVPPRDMEVATRELRHSQAPPERVLLDRGRRPRILVAEDEDDLRGFIAGVLKGSHIVDVAKNGAEALELLKQNRPDLVLTDVMMPGVSGLDLTRTIKSDPSLRHIPVILLTARGENEAALEGYEAGADEFVSKPFHTKVLQARIRAHLKMRGLSLQLADQARLASAGTLAAGLAHEVKNPLNAAMSAVKVLEQGGSSRVSNEKLMGVVVNALARIDSIISALDAHARPADGDDLTPCNVRDAIESTLNLLDHKLKNRVTVHQSYGASGDVFASARAFNQVLLNLVDNSIRSDAKNIWIELQQTEQTISVAVADDGPGVPPEVVHRIFDPFFTTRVEGEGTGLGLHLSRRIARDCGGELRYEPRPGGGARFVMEIPAMGLAA